MNENKNDFGLEENLAQKLKNAENSFQIPVFLSATATASVNDSTATATATASIAANSTAIANVNANNPGHKVPTNASSKNIAPIENKIYSEAECLEACEKRQADISEAKKRKARKFAGWFLGSSSGDITPKEWMDFFKNAALYSLIFGYVIYPGPSNYVNDSGWMVIVSQVGILIIGVFLVSQAIALAVLTWPNRNETKYAPLNVILMVVKLVISVTALFGIFFGVVNYFIHK